jgi:hypothetical protein
VSARGFLRRNGVMAAPGRTTRAPLTPSAKPAHAPRETRVAAIKRDAEAERAMPRLPASLRSSACTSAKRRAPKLNLKLDDFGRRP